jgi:hypothetical protein
MGDIREEPRRSEGEPWEYWEKGGPGRGNNWVLLETAGRPIEQERMSEGRRLGNEAGEETGARSPRPCKLC